MQQTSSPRVLEFAPPCKNLARILVLVYSLSFGLTWYKVWWDSIIGLVVAIWGWYALWQTPHALPVPRQVEFFYKGNVLSMLSHAIALGVVLYFTIQSHYFNDLLGIKDTQEKTMGWTFTGFEIALLIGEMVLAGTTIARCQSLLAEMERNKVCIDLTHGGMHV